MAVLRTWVDAAASSLAVFITVRLRCKHTSRSSKEIGMGKLELHSRCRVANLIRTTVRVSRGSICPWWEGLVPFLSRHSLTHKTTTIWHCSKWLTMVDNSQAKIHFEASLFSRIVLEIQCTTVYNHLVQQTSQDWSIHPKILKIILGSRSNLSSKTVA